MSKFPSHLLKKNTPNGTFMFLYVDKPDYEFKENGEYSCSLLLNSVDAKPFVEEIDALILETKSSVRTHSIPKVKVPYEILHPATCQKYKDITEVESSPSDVLIKFRTNAKFRNKKTGIETSNKVLCFDESGSEVDTSFVMRGSKCYVVYNLYPYTFGNTCGVRCTLHEIHFREVITKAMKSAS